MAKKPTFDWRKICTRRSVKRRVTVFLQRVKEGKEQLPRIILDRLTDLLSNRASKTEFDLFAEFLDDQEDQVRIAAARCLEFFAHGFHLANQGTPWLVQGTASRLVKAIDDPVAEIRWHILAALTKLQYSDTETMLPAILRRLKDKDAQVREAAILAARNLGIDQASAIISELIRLLADPSPQVRLCACEIMEWLGPEATTAIPALGNCTKVGNPAAVRSRAAQALAVIDPTGEELLKSLDKGTVDAVTVALRELGKSGRSLRRALMAAQLAGAGAETDDRSPPKAGTVAADQQRKDSDDMTPNVFRRDGEDWEIRFNGGKTIRLGNLVGLFYIHEIIRKPKDPCFATELRADWGRQQTDESARTWRGAEQNVRTESDSSPQHVHDAGKVTGVAELRQCHFRLQEIEEEIEKARSHNEEGPLERLQREKGDILAQVKAATRKGKLKHLQPKSKQDQDAVRNRIIDALKKIEKKDPALNRHLQHIVRIRSGFFKYSPENPISWDT